ncbi:hypothetical protein D3C76_1412990 [compost metagenome]
MLRFPLPSYLGFRDSLFVLHFGCSNKKVFSSRTQPVATPSVKFQNNWSMMRLKCGVCLKDWLRKLWQNKA